MFQLEGHRSRTQSGKFKETQAAQAGASALGGGAERWPWRGQAWADENGSP